MPDIANPFRIGKLIVRPGDTVVVKDCVGIAAHQVKDLEAYFTARLPDGVKVVILQRGIDVKVMRRLKVKTMRKRKGK
jgi:hypothetical protein